MKQSQSGQTLMEAVIVIGMAVILVTAVVAATTVALKAGQNTKTRSKAGLYLQNGIESARKLRDSDWTTFRSYDATQKCLDSSGNFSNSPCSNPIDGIYTSSITFTWEPLDGSHPDRMKLESVVTWQEGTQTKRISAITYMTNWKNR